MENLIYKYEKPVLETHHHRYHHHPRRRCPSAGVGGGIIKKIHRGRLLHEVVKYGLLERRP